MIEGVTKSGFAYRVSEKLGNDFRLVRALAKIKNDDGGDTLLGLVEAAELILGREGVDALCAHVQDEDGTVPTDRMTQELMEIMGSCGQKNGEVKN